GPLRWTAMTASHSSSVMLKIIRSRRIPAQQTSTCRSPNSRSASSMSALPPAIVATLSGLGTALPPALRISSMTSLAGPLDGSRPSTPTPESFTTTLAPARARSSDTARPMPVPPPVTTATLPSSSPISASLDHSPWMRARAPCWRVARVLSRRSPRQPRYNGASGRPRVPRRRAAMAGEYAYVMKDLRKVVPPKREILRGIWLSFFHGAKIGVLGANGAGKSTLLRIMAGVDDDFLGEAWAADGLRVGHLPQEPKLDPAKDVRGNVDDGVAETRALLER